MDGLRERVVRQRARFIEDYDDYVDQARLDLGKLFRIEDYPSKEALQDKFSIRYRITPVPNADHFIAKLASDVRRRRLDRDARRSPYRLPTQHVQSSSKLSNRSIGGYAAVPVWCTVEKDSSGNGFCRKRIFEDWGQGIDQTGAGRIRDGVRHRDRYGC